MSVALNEENRPVARKRRKNKSECLYDDLAEQIYSGSLKPGERLATYRELSRLYGVSQGIITTALRNLIKNGLIETRDRSHCFVTRNPRQNVTPSSSSPQSSGPAKSQENTLVIYNSEFFSTNLILWQQVIAEFKKAHPELEITILSALDGSLPDLLQACQPDLVISSEDLLMTLGDQYISPPDTRMLREICLPRIQGA